ncbi:MAG: class I SAM-dependent methyltransferase [Mariprofundaceae bacterium]|nr:class I SAM-dependent methyltransferase [Mariprofundaceae bacterium]
MNRPLFEHCPLGCTTPLITTDIELPEGNLRQCPDCGQLLSSCTQTWYDESMREFDVPEGTLPQGGSQKRHEQRISRILQQARAQLPGSPDPVMFLDVGCSSGSVLNVARQCGFNIHGVEPAARAAETARQIPGAEVFNGFLHQADYPDNHFDIITLFEVIEHLTDPISLIKEIGRILKPGGLLLIGTGNAGSWTVSALGSRWEYFDIRLHGGHISFFTPESISILAKKSGLKLSAIKTKRVNLGEKKDVSWLFYQFNRVMRELLALPARWFNKGHDMLIVLRKPE